VTVSQNGFTPATELKPRIVRRVKEIGRAEGFQTFSLSDPHIRFDLAGTGYTGSVMVRFNSDPGTATPSGVLFVDSPDDYTQDLPTEKSASLAKIQSSRWHDEDLNLYFSITPVYLDAVNAKLDSWSGVLDSYLKPGPHRLIAMANSVESGRFVWVELAAELRAGRQYRLTGKFDVDTLRYWVEDVEASRPAGETVSVHTGRPRWAKPLPRP
jgi:hypothetical protein